jgi:hypothetical protein
VAAITDLRLPSAIVPGVADTIARSLGLTRIAKLRATASFGRCRLSLEILFKPNFVHPLPWPQDSGSLDKIPDAPARHS